MSRIVPDYSALGHHSDPVNGDVDDIGVQANNLRTVANNVNQAHEDLERLLNSEHESDRLDAILTETRAVTGKLTLVVGRYEGAARALDHYRETLAPIQSEADQLARDAIPQHQYDVNNYDDAVALQRQANTSTDQATFDARHAEYQSLERRRTAARTAVNDAKSKLKGLIEARKVAAKDAAKAIEQAADSSGLTDGIMDHFGKLVDGAKEWLMKHSDLMNTIGKYLGYASAVLGLLAILCPPLGLVAAGFAAAGAVFNIVGALGKALKDGDWLAFAKSVGIAALSIIPFAKSLGQIGKIAKLGKVSLASAAKSFIKAQGNLPNLTRHAAAKARTLIRQVGQGKLYKAPQAILAARTAMTYGARTGVTKVMTKLGISSRFAVPLSAPIVNFAEKSARREFGSRAMSLLPDRSDAGTNTQRTYMPVAA